MNIEVVSIGALRLCVFEARDATYSFSRPVFNQEYVPSISHNSVALWSIESVQTPTKSTLPSVHVWLSSVVPLTYYSNKDKYRQDATCALRLEYGLWGSFLLDTPYIFTIADFKIFFVLVNRCYLPPVKESRSLATRVLWVSSYTLSEEERRVASVRTLAVHTRSSGTDTCEWWTVEKLDENN